MLIKQFNNKVENFNDNKKNSLQILYSCFKLEFKRLTLRFEIDINL